MIRTKKGIINPNMQTNIKEVYENSSTALSMIETTLKKYNNNTKPIDKIKEFIKEEKYENIHDIINLHDKLNKKKTLTRLKTYLKKYNLELEF